MIEMDLVGVRVELPSNTPIVLLREQEGPRYLPIWIGAVEATAIAYEQGDWGEVDALVAELGLESNFLPEAYHRTLAWVGELLAA